MKTLLLTLLVVTIVCLDLGYTLECHNQQSSQAPTTTGCSGGETNCYKKSWRDHRGYRIERGCGCPSVKKGIEINCCTTDRCNN
uniref:Alpha-neurotoxin NTX-2 n=1 Tax=Naja sputatrix TaxID=33626 RepID=3S1A2_NAJSP|nr:RecName: Full=Alpha-neurotoxin NTX-2; Short=NTX2; Flags: Precursor [Naja sputatrix]AAD08813.1 post synaptic alpha neurotoxin precursor [Naja sputatrix]